MIDGITKLLDIAVKYVLITTCLNYIYMGIPIISLMFKQKQKSYMIKGSGNYSEKQSKFECSGFSSAFVYRHLGKDVKGKELYNEIPCKLHDGTVYCKGLIKLARKYGFKARLRTGNITALKNAVTVGNPVIVLVHSKAGSAGLHYTTIVGYDDEYFYLIDSVGNYRNEETENYNRKVTIKEFRKLWNIISWERPLYSNIFFEISL